MVGGIVIEVIDCVDRYWINCAEVPCYSNPLKPMECAIYTQKATGFNPKPGDALWWHGSYAFWTAKNEFGETTGKQDTRIPRIGFSGVNRPDMVNR